MTLDLLTANQAPNLVAHLGGSSLGNPDQAFTSQALVPLRWEKRLALEGMTKIGQGQAFFLKESPLAVGEEGYTAEEVGQESVEVPVQYLYEDHRQESPLLSGPLNQWRHSGLRTQSLHQDMTILQLTDALQNWKERNLLMEFLRVAEKGRADLGQPDHQGKTSPLASGG